MILKMAVAAKLLGCSRQYIDNLSKKNPPPDFIVLTNGKKSIDTSASDWYSISEKSKFDGKYNNEVAAGLNLQPAIKPAPPQPEPENIPAMDSLVMQAKNAELQGAIHKAAIQEQKSIQEGIKTLEIKKDLAPLYLVKHFFGFAEGMVHRGYRRFNEIMPELEALILAGKTKEATKLLISEQENIVKESTDELMKSMKEEGLPLKKNK